MTRWQTFLIELRGGLISNLSPLQHGLGAVGSCTILQNYEPTKDGGYRRIKGYEKFSNTQVTGSGNILGVKVIDSTDILVARSNGSATVWYHGSGTTWTSKATASSVGGRVNHVEADFTGTRKTILVDGVNTPAVYDHSAETVTYEATPLGTEADYDGASCVEVFKQAAFYGNGHLLVFTAPSTVDDFLTANGAGVIEVGDTIQGLKTFRDQLIVFCSSKILRITGSSSADYQVVPISEDIGCVDGFTIQEVGGDIMFLAPDGLRLLSATDRIGDFGFNVASNPISQSVRTFSDTNTFFCSTVLREKAQYRVFGFTAGRPRSSSIGLMSVKKSDQGSSNIEWATLKGINVFSVDSKYANSSEIIVFGNDDGYIYKMEAGNSWDGVAIESILETPFMPINDPEKRKTIYRVVNYIDSSGPFKINMNLKYDYNRFNGWDVINPDTQEFEAGGSFTVYGQAVYGQATFGSAVDTTYRTFVTGSGRTVAIRLTDNTSNTQYTLDSMTLEYDSFDQGKKRR